MAQRAACYVIAEIGVNHNGDVGLAKELIDEAAAAGADAVKFQTFFADELVTQSAAMAKYQTENTGAGQSQHGMLKALELTENDFAELFLHCRFRGVSFLSTPFSPRAADLLEAVGVNAFKISSGDLTYLQMLAHIAQKGKPIILSTGMACLSEIEDAVRVIEAEGNRSISILHCVSDYPAKPGDCNLAAMETISHAFGYPVGWSDHTQGGAITCAAVAMGAEIIEKHITLDCKMDGPDHAASMEPGPFGELVRNIRDIECAIGSRLKSPTDAEKETATVARRSLVASRDLSEGAMLELCDIDVLRPGTGFAPKMMPLLVGRRLGQDVAQGTPFDFRHFKALDDTDG